MNIIHHYSNMHDYTNQFSMKWKKNQFGGRKVVNACPLRTKVGGHLPTLPNRLRLQ